MYSLLTGLWVFYDEPRTAQIQKKIKNGETAFIDPRWKERSVEEAKLVQAIEWCHQYNPDDRPTIFQLVDFLKQAVEVAKLANAVDHAAKLG
jgi:serine/threonine protein kinase